MKIRNAMIVIVVILVGIIYTSAFTVSETQQVVVTQFGRLVGQPITAPGLHFKIPFIQKTTFFPKNLLNWDGDPGQIPTLDKTYIWVDTFARWKIVDAVKFFQTVGDVARGMGRLDDIIDPAVRNFITSYSLIESVRSSNRELELEIINDTSSPTESEDVTELPPGQERATIGPITAGRKKITDEILKQARPKLTRFGIELMDVKIKRINYVEQVRKSVYGRMIAERRQIAEKFRSEGKGESQKIIGDKERDLKKITSEAYRTAQEIMGKGDAEATTIYAQSFGADPDFYSFLKTLEIYPKTLGEKSSLVLSTKSEFLQYLKGYTGQ
jgi:membrane protease subunit HflC